MATFNRVVLMGNLTRDPQLRDAGSTGHKVCDMAIAVGEKRKDSTGAVREILIDVSAAFDHSFSLMRDKIGELCAQYLHKGSPVLVEGKLQMDSWEKDGQKRTKLKVRAMTVKFLSPGPSGQQASGQQAASVQSPAQPAAPAAPVDQLASDPDDIPF